MVDTTEKDQSNHVRELCAWIESIPLLKARRNLSGPSIFRDFSDAVLLAEILKIYYPRYVDLRNYIPVNNIFMKKENWNTLNRKVLCKIDVKLNKDTINQLACGHQGVIEKVLLEIKNKIAKDTEQLDLNLSKSEENTLQFNDEEDTEAEANQMENRSDHSTMMLSTISTPQESLEIRRRPNRSSFFVIVCLKNTIVSLTKWLVGLVSFWNLFSSDRTSVPAITSEPAETVAEGETICDSKEETTSAVASLDEDVVPRQLCAQLKQELREKDNIICTLNHKVAYLEGAMKLKDLRISNLTSQIVQQAVDMDNLTKSQISNQLPKARGKMPHSAYEAKQS